MDNDMLPDFTGPELCAFEAHEVVDLLERKKISSEELLDASLARIETVEPADNAMPTVCSDRARAAADVSASKPLVAAG